MTDPNWRLTPRTHQLAAYLDRRDTLNWGLWWDQGTGKTAEVLAQAAHLNRTGKINALLVLAPRGVEANWVFDEIPKHWPEDLPMEVSYWTSKKSKGKRWMEAYKEFQDSDAPMKILAMSYSAMMTDRGAKAAKKFLKTHNVFYVLDESTAIKTPDTKTAKRVVASGQYGKYRRCLNGTPVEDSPFQLFTQVKFLDPNVWTSRGINTYQQFKAMFGIWESVQMGNGKSFPQLKSYRNLDLLNTCMYEVGDRVLKDDLEDLPPKSYTKVYYELSPKANKLYADLKHHYSATTESGEVLDAELAIVRLTRFQQIASGYFPRDEEADELVPIEKSNPRIQALATALDGVSGQMIIYAKYLKDIEAIEELLKKRGMSFGTYVGATDEDERQRIKEDFQSGQIQVFLANKAAAKGLTLTAARTVIFYNNSFSAETRKQQEDRAHRIGQEHPVLYIDIIASATVDEHILATLRRKKATACTVTGDQFLAWI